MGHAYFAQKGKEEEEEKYMHLLITVEYCCALRNLLMIPKSRGCHHNLANSLLIMIWRQLSTSFCAKYTCMYVSAVHTYFLDILKDIGKYSRRVPILNLRYIAILINLAKPSE